MKSKSKVKINYKRLIILILFLYALIYTLYTIINMPIKNIYIKNNTLLTDQEIIEIAKLDDYPSIITTLSFVIEKRLSDNTYITSAKVIKNLSFSLTIEIVENKPIFYNRRLNKIVLQDGKVVNGRYNVGTLINYVPDSIYDNFIKQMAKVDQDIIERISEIEYKPNAVDEGRFYLSMKDGNYVYLTIKKFTAVNDYIDIVKTLNNKKGILYLDDAGFFEVIER
jgi:cell division protein FtsQ